MEGIKVLLMNAGIDQSGGKRLVCQQALSNIVREHTPQLVILQEFSPPTDEYWETRVKDEYSKTAIVAGNVIMYKKNCLSRIDLNSEILDELKLSTCNPLKKMAVAKFQTMTEPSFEFICVSWHGPWNKLNKQECEKDEKVSIIPSENAVEFKCGNVDAMLKLW